MVTTIEGTSFTVTFLAHCEKLLQALDTKQIDRAVEILAKVRQQQGRLFIAGSGGGAGHASHATCDFRKLCGIEAYSPYDNVSELTARINDEGWDSSLSEWLKVSRITSKDALLVFSVGGGCQTGKISMNLVNAIAHCKKAGAQVIGIVGRDGGYTAKNADCTILIPAVDSSLVTPLTEGFQAVIWHLLVSHPGLQTSKAKWESLSNNEHDVGSR